MSKRKKKSAVRRRPSFIFEDMCFYEDPCKKHTYVYAIGGKGKDGTLGMPVVIAGPADMIRKITTALRNA